MKKFSRAGQSWLGRAARPFAVAAGLAALCPLAQTQRVRASALPPLDGSAARASEMADGNDHVLPVSPGGHRQAAVRSEEADQTLTTKFADGWFVEETSPTGVFRWMPALAHIDVTSRRAGTLVIRAHVRSFVPDNSLELLLDDKLVQAIKLRGTNWQDCLVRASGHGDAHHLGFRSHQPGAQPPGDNRVLTVCVENFAATLEP